MNANSNISVVTTCFNDGQMLHLPVGSVARQTRPAIEHIIVDDGSTEPETLEILDDLERAGDVTIIHQPNTGLAGARNTGIKAATGDYIFPLDADDRIPEDCLETLGAVLDENLEITVAYGDYATFGLEERTVRTGLPNSYRLLLNNYMPVSSLFRRTAWETSGGYTEEILGFDDWEFWIKLMERGMVFRKVDKVTYFHHVHSNNMWLRDKSKWKRIIDQIHSLHPDLYSRQHLSKMRKQNHVTWLENAIYRLPPPTRYQLRRSALRFAIPVANGLGLFRDK